MRELSGILNKSIDNNNSNSNKENNIVINFNPTINVNGNENVGETVKAELETIVENVLVSKLRTFGAMTSEWYINGLNLPISPSTEVESVNRIFQVQTVYNFFPQLENPTASSFDYTITGYLYPEKLVLQLDSTSPFC